MKMRVIFSVMLIVLVALMVRADDRPAAKVLQDGSTVQETAARAKENRRFMHCYSLAVADRSIWQLTLSRAAASKTPLEGHLRIYRNNSEERPVFEYEITPNYSDYLFLPVLDEGEYLFEVSFQDRTRAGEPFSLSIRRYKPEVSEVDKKAASEAIDRGIAALLKGKPPKEFERHDPAIESLVVAALAGGKDRASRAQIIEKDYLEALKALMTPSEKGTWEGQKVTGLEKWQRPGYQQPIYALAMAEAAAVCPGAKDLGAQAGAYLMAMQNSSRKCRGWHGPSRKDKPDYGGWRYDVDSENSDISVTGWCIIALTALDAEKIPLPGLRDVLEDALAYIKRCGSDKGFGYTANDGDIGSTRNAIGALICQLYGEQTESLKAALEHLDSNLCAGTQLAERPDYRLYCWYYGTRTNYLRGGFVWEAWRSTMIRQLLKHQKADGSWRIGGEEEDLGPRYSTALSVMILRICLNDVPGYLRQEVRGF